MTDEHGLLPCPFCGSEARSYSYGTKAAVAHCSSETCHARPEIHTKAGEEAAIDLWNRRINHERDLRDARSLIQEMTEVLEDTGLWIDQMQVGVNKWAGDAVGLLARQDNLNAFKNGDVKQALAKAKSFLERMK